MAVSFQKRSIADRPGAKMGDGSRMELNFHTVFPTKSTISRKSYDIYYFTIYRQTVNTPSKQNNQIAVA